MPEFKLSQTILFYCSFDGEVETLGMMRHASQIGKKIALPVIIKEKKRIVPTIIEHIDADLHEGHYGIKAPRHDKTRELKVSELDLVVVPAVAFDKNNNRLGRGSGYYDRFLGELPSHIPTVGLAFDFQVVDLIPGLQHHDIPVSHVIVN